MEALVSCMRIMLQLSADGASNAMSCTSLVVRMAGMALGLIECAFKGGPRLRCICTKALNCTLIGISCCSGWFAVAVAMHLLGTRSRLKEGCAGIAPSLEAWCCGS